MLLSPKTMAGRICRIIGNLYSIFILQRLASKSGFNKLVLAFFQFLAVLDLIFLAMLIISDGLLYGIFINERPLWLDLIYPFVIHPMFYMFRFCTAYMLVVISIERCIVLSNSLAYNTKCYSYILLVVLCSSELPISLIIEKRFKNIFLSCSYQYPTKIFS